MRSHYFELPEVGQEDRVVELAVPFDCVVSWMAAALKGADGSGMVMLPKFDVPHGTKVVGAHCDDRARCVRFVLAHPSFPSVPPGQIPPGVEGKYLGPTLYQGTIDMELIDKAAYARRYNVKSEEECDKPHSIDLGGEG